MQTAAILPSGSTLPSSAPPAKQAPTNSAGSPFNQVLAQQIQGHKISKQTEKPADNNTDNTSKADVALAKVDESEALSEDKVTTDAVLPGAETQFATPAELLALVANIHQVTNKLENSNASPQLNDELSLLSGNELAKEPLATRDTKQGNSDISKDPLALLDSKQNTLGRPPHASNFIDKSGRLSDATMTSTDPHIGLQSEFAATAQKIHEMAIPTSTPIIAQMSQVPLNLLQAAAPQLTEKLAPQVGLQGWDQALGQKIVWMIAGSQQSATLTLNPPDLGPLQIILNVSNDQADATFISTQPEVRQALEAALPKLREMMNEAGIQLSDATVSSNSQNQHGASPQHSPKASNNSNNNKIDSVTAPQVIQTRSFITGKQMVDTFA